MDNCSKNHLYITNNIGLLVVGLPRHLAMVVYEYFNVDEYNLYTDFTIPIQITKLDLLQVYKKDDLTEIPALGLSADKMEYLYVDN